MKPWCAEGEVPTAANLNLQRGWNSCVGWHRDDELLFREYSDAKLIVSVSVGSSAVFRWRRQSCPDDEGHLCWLGHGDMLVKDGQYQDEYLHRTDPGREQERINLTFRWVKQHASSCPLVKAGVACCLPTCVQGCSFPVMVNFGFGVAFFWILCFFLVFCAHWEFWLCLAPCCVQDLGFVGVPLAGHALWAEVGLGITFLPPGENTSKFKKVHVFFYEAFRRNCRQIKCKTSFSPFWVFLFSRNSLGRFWCVLVWHLWIGRARHPGPSSDLLF